MSKIGILTYHDGSNRGSILQAYSLYRSLQGNNIANEVEIIDYRTFSRELAKLLSIRLNFISKFIYRFKDFNTAGKFYQSQNALSEGLRITDDFNKAIDFIRKQNYDMIVVGSDTVWRLEKGKKASFRARPFPNAYFLDPDLECIKASYAASANGTDYKNLSESERETYQRHLLGFDKIGVRDKHTEDFLNKLGISDIRRVPDPTILMDFPEQDLTPILTDNGISLDKPILGIYRCGKFSKTIEKHYRKKGYQIVSPFRSIHADLSLFDKISPLEYYSVHKHFDFVITGSFHTTIFSIKNGTPFATLDSSKAHLIDKKETLLEEFSLLDRHISVGEQNKKNLLNNLKKCEKEFDKKNIQKRISSMKQRGFGYIQELGEMLDGKKV